MDHSKATAQHMLQRPLDLALGWSQAGQGVVLATVVDTWGSAPCGVGACLAVSSSGAVAGSVSGGCVEADVIAEAAAFMQARAPKLLRYGVSNETAFEVGLACGGQIAVLLEAVRTDLPVELLSKRATAAAGRHPVAYQVDLNDGARAVFPVGPTATTTFDGQTFMLVTQPAPRLVIAGAVHIAQALVPMAQIAGFDVAVVDPRTAFLGQAAFAGTQQYDAWPDAALEELGVDAATAVVTLTHDPKLDDPALATALQSDAFYIGCLGSARTHAKRCARLRALGHDTARLNGPVGLPIGAATPPEIAVAILAQVIAAWRGHRG